MAAGALWGALAALLVALFSQGLLWYYSGNGMISTGAPQGTDLLTYFAMVRAVLRSPNGITYVYPYSLYWPVPPVALQLPITLIAWISRVTGVPVAFEVGRVLGGAAAGAAVASLAAMFPRGFWRRWFLVAAVLGGGLLGVRTLAVAIEISGWPGLTEPHAYVDRGFGRMLWWLPYLAQNLRMPLECIYHGVVLGALACLVWGRMGWAWVLGLAVWWCNPFSAVALHSAVLPWLAWCAWENRRAAGGRRWVLWLGAWLAACGAAAYYYGVFLKQWELYRELDRQYRQVWDAPLDWGTMALLTLPFGAGLLASMAWPRLRRGVWGHRRWRLFALMALVHVALMQQGFILGKSALQAFHYNRGYLHLALVITAWRVLMLAVESRGCHRATAGRAWLGLLPWRLPAGRCRRWGVAVAAVTSLTCLDQVLFVAFALDRTAYVGLEGAAYAELVRSIPAQPAPAIVLTEPVTTPGSYLTAASPHIAYDAPETMVVPFPRRRVELMHEAMAGKNGGLAGLGINYVIASDTNTEWQGPLTAQGWHKVKQVGRLALWGR